MADIDDLSRRDLTFEQAEGVESLPEQLKLGEISDQLRALVWKYIYADMIYSSQDDQWSQQYWDIGQPWFSMLLDWHIDKTHKFADEFNKNFQSQVQFVKSIIQTPHYVRFYGFLEFLIRHERCRSGLKLQIEGALGQSKAAYRIIDDSVVPIASEEEGESISRAFQDLTRLSSNGAKSHLKQAASSLTSGTYADSIRHSISAVESVALKLDSSSKTLGPALRELEKQGSLHKALKEGFSKLYGFTSDEQGIRHALLDTDSASVDEADALYMLGACAAFVSYLVNKTDNNS